MLKNQQDVTVKKFLAGSLFFGKVSLSMLNSTTTTSSSQTQFTPHSCSLPISIMLMIMSNAHTAVPQA